MELIIAIVIGLFIYIRKTDYNKNLGYNIKEEDLIVSNEEDFEYDWVSVNIVLKLVTFFISVFILALFIFNVIISKSIQRKYKIDVLSICWYFYLLEYTICLVFNPVFIFSYYGLILLVAFIITPNKFIIKDILIPFIKGVASVIVVMFMIYGVCML